MTDIKTFYKGFDENMRCLGFQYAEGETYTQQGKIGVCVNGFHACGLPLDVWSYYPLRDGNLYHEVTLDGIAENDGGDSKVAAREITVGASLDLVGLIRAHVEAVFDRTAKKSESHAATTGRWANAVTTGYGAHADAKSESPDAIAAALGRGKAKGVLGGWLVLTERDAELTILDVQAILLEALIF